MSPPPVRPSCPPRPSRVLPVWLCAVLAFVVALVLVRAPAFLASGDPQPPNAADRGTSLPGEATNGNAVAIDDDNGDEAVDLSPGAVFMHDDGAPLVSNAPRADAVGQDPPGLPPPEA